MQEDSGDWSENLTRADWGGALGAGATTGGNIGLHRTPPTKRSSSHHLKQAEVHSVFILVRIIRWVLDLSTTFIILVFFFIALFLHRIICFIVYQKLRLIVECRNKCILLG
jgi:hypothetical protein